MASGPRGSDVGRCAHFWRHLLIENDDQEMAEPVNASLAAPAWRTRRKPHRMVRQGYPGRCHAGSPFPHGRQAAIRGIDRVGAVLVLSRGSFLWPANSLDTLAFDGDHWYTEKVVGLWQE